MAVRPWVVLSALAGCLAWPAGGDARREPPASNVLIAGYVGRQHAYACGVIVAETRETITVVTAKHNLAIEQPDYLTVSGERLQIRAVHEVAGHDQVLLTARRPRGRFGVAVARAQPPAGMRVTVWGPIADLPFTEHAGATRPIDERVADVPADAVAIECAACDHGDSGTGVYDDDGRLVGIVTRGYYDGARKVFVLVERIEPETIARIAP